MHQKNVRILGILKWGGVTLHLLINIVYQYA